MTDDYTQPPEADLDDHFDDFDDYEDFEEQAARGFTMRHPILLVLVLVGASFMAYKTWPRAAYFFADLADCGALSDRPMLKQNDPEKVPPLNHDTYCTLDGTVHLMHALATVKKDGNQPGSNGGQLESRSELAGSSTTEIGWESVLRSCCRPRRRTPTPVEQPLWISGKGKWSTLRSAAGAWRPINRVVSTA